MVSGLTPFGPAFNKLEVGDEIEVVDGAEVTRALLSVQYPHRFRALQVWGRRKRDGDCATMHLVRTCSAHLLTAHSLAVNLDTTVT